MSKIYIPRLPFGWNQLTGLKYPLTVRLASGELVEFQNYEQHHEFIWNKFKNFEMSQYDLFTPLDEKGNSIL